MRMRRLFGAATVAFGSAAGTIGIAQSPVAIGLVREDGYLIPIAVITSKLLDTPIPTATFVNGEPLSRDEPEWPFKDLGWMLSFGGGRPEAAIQTIEPRTVRSYCGDQDVWRTSLKLPATRENVAPTRKIGLAISGGTIEHPQDVVAQPDAASRRVARRIVALTHARELERIAKEPAQWLPSAHSTTERAKVPVRLAKLRRHSTAGITTYYFEATKAWGADPQHGLVTGWIVDAPSGLTDHDVAYKFNDDSFKENERAIVWGVVRYQEKTLWILEWHGYEIEYYTVHEWPAGVERVSISGGAC